MTKNNQPKILAIDTSCDETSVAVLSGRRVLSNVVSSQIELHRKWGGVVPAIAKRAHIENLPGSYNEAMKRAGLEIEDLDAIAATQGPGLAIDLEVGLKFAQQLAINNKKKFIPVNHMEGHLLSGLILNSKGKGTTENSISMSSLRNNFFPALGMLISGKHTEIIYIKDFGDYEKLGRTLDDAAGEAFDKVGRMLGFGYPGGPIISEFAKKGKQNDLITLPIPLQHSKELNFSYSGLKTACLYKIKELRESGHKDTEWVNDFCFTFVDTVAKTITLKLKKAIKTHPEIKAVFTGGGVYKNEYIVRKVGNLSREFDLKFLLPEMKYRGDNAAMIAIAAQSRFTCSDYITTIDAIQNIDRSPRLELG